MTTDYRTLLREYHNSLQETDLLLERVNRHLRSLYQVNKKTQILLRRLEKEHPYARRYSQPTNPYIGGGAAVPSGSGQVAALQIDPDPHHQPQNNRTRRRNRRPPERRT